MNKKQPRKQRSDNDASREHEAKPEDMFMGEGYEVTFLYMASRNRQGYETEKERRRELIKALEGVLRVLKNGEHITIQKAARYWAKARYIAASCDAISKASTRLSQPPAGSQSE